MKRLTDLEFARCVQYVRERYGINLEKKRTLIESRLYQEVEQRGFESYGAFLRAALSEPDGEAAQSLINRLSTNYTFFFREPRSFEYLAKKAFPALMSGGERALRVWCAACASGEEAYSIAMTLARCFLPSGRACDYQLLATDVNSEMLAAARLARYPLKALEAAPREYRHFFIAGGSEATVCRAISERVTFRLENLLLSERLGCMDVIFCRNVMIYFAPAERERLIKKLCAALKPNGYLFISCTENISFSQKELLHLEPGVYRKRGDCK